MVVFAFWGGGRFTLFLGLKKNGACISSSIFGDSATNKKDQSIT